MYEFEPFSKRIQKKIGSFRFVKLLGSGTKHKNYQIVAKKKFYVLRMRSLVNDSNKRLRNEYGALKLLSGNGFPEVYGYFCNKEYEVTVMDYVSGTSLDKLSITMDVSFAKKIAKLLANLHNTPIKKGLKSYRVSQQSYLTQMKKLFAHAKNYSPQRSWMQLIEKKLLVQLKPKKLKRIRTIGHGDFYKGNIVKYRNTYALIDFEELGVWDPAADIANLFVASEMRFTQAMQKAFFAEYFVYRKDETLLERVEEYTRFKVAEVLAWNCMIIAQVQRGTAAKHLTLKHELKYTRRLLRMCKELGLLSKSASLPSFT